jgi:hypothetical protein
MTRNKIYLFPIHEIEKLCLMERQIQIEIVRKER